VVAERTLALTQRDILLREVYHRVKNNLQIIDSFLVMQSRHLSDPAARAALLSLRRRVYALGLVHHQLMGSTNLRTFDVAPFLRELSLNILEGGAGRDVTLSVEAAAMDVGLDFAIPLGLLVTELVTNSLKHAFPSGSGNISVSLQRADNGEVALIVADDGQGHIDHPRIGEVSAVRSTTGLGSSIIAGLVAQLRGTMTMKSDPGTRAEIRVASPVLS
jgi:two-component sensor histidine kinase